MAYGSIKIDSIVSSTKTLNVDDIAVVGDLTSSPLPSIATQAEAQAGTANAVLMTPLRTAEAIAALASDPAFATQAQAENGAATDVVMSPLRTAQAIAALGGGGGGGGGGLALGDVITTARTLTAPAYLACDGQTYSQSAYPALLAELGQQNPSIDVTGVTKIEIPTLVAAANDFVPAVARLNNIVCYVRSSGGNYELLYSTDTGATFTVSSSYPFSNIYGTQAPYFTTIGSIIFALVQEFSGDLYRLKFWTSTNGSTWTLRTTQESPPGVSSMSSLNGDLIFKGKFGVKPMLAFRFMDNSYNDKQTRFTVFNSDGTFDQVFNYDYPNGSASNGETFGNLIKRPNGEYWMFGANKDGSGIISQGIIKKTTNFITWTTQEIDSLINSFGMLVKGFAVQGPEGLSVMSFYGSNVRKYNESLGVFEPQVYSNLQLNPWAVAGEADAQLVFVRDDSDYFSQKIRVSKDGGSSFGLSTSLDGYGSRPWYQLEGNEQLIGSENGLMIFESSLKYGSSPIEGYALHLGVNVGPYNPATMFKTPVIATPSGITSYIKAS